MTPVGVISVVPLFPVVHSKLIELLSGLRENDWNLPTACPQWSVRDIAAHLLDGEIRKLSGSRDGFVPPPPSIPISGFADLVAFLNDLNAQWVVAARRMSPRVLTD